jgi:hypothetical protein
MRLAATLLVVGLAVPAAARELEKVTMDETVNLADINLKLNGMGLRTYWGKRYVGGLYLAMPSKDPAKILASDSARQLTMHQLKDFDREKGMAMLRDGMKKNSPQAFEAQKANVEKFLSWIPEVKEGSRLVFAYLPGKGTTMFHDSRELGTIPGKAFADVLFANFIGSEPPSEELKKGLLGL